MIGENAMKDSELIQKVHSGNKEAVGIIIKRYYADIYTKFGRWYTKWDGMRIVQIKIGYSKEKMMHIDMGMKVYESVYRSIMEKISDENII